MLDKQIKGATFYYDSYVRLSGKSIKEPTLKCNGTVMTKFGDNTTDMYVGTLTADEIVYAGGKVSTNNPDYYLINDYHKSNNSLYFWSLSPSTFSSNTYNTGDYVFSMEHDGSLSTYAGTVVVSFVSFRPSIILKTDTKITSGDGTKTNAYKVS